MDLRERKAGLSTRHPWEVVRAGFFSDLVARFLPRGGDVLDLGAGDGYVAGQLARILSPGSTVTCVDSNYSDADIAALERRAPSVSFASEVPPRRFDAVLLLDVIEHVVDDVSLIRTISKQLAAPGIVVISVPAFPSLYTQHDVALGHYRRYTARSLGSVVRAAGLAVRAQGSLFASLVVPRLLSKVLERARGIDSEPSAQLHASISNGVNTWSRGRLISAGTIRALQLDAAACALAARWRIPAPGLSVWAVCEQPT
jgi:2-polyprenyl-3-methyl-5-hydroxy-6-metoxy-1,4-benzoquinol methylase